MPNASLGTQIWADKLATAYGGVISAIYVRDK
jgi:hypothetical protein